MEKIRFKYHPNIYEDDILVHKSGTCQCCGRQISEFIEHVYSSEDVDCICLQCVSDGTAAQKFDAVFVGWQDENWLACCDDYCQYLGRVGIDELNDLGIKDEVLQEYAKREDAYSLEEVEEYLYKDGDMSGYLFKCIHCNKYHLWVDAN